MGSQGKQSRKQESRSKKVTSPSTNINTVEMEGSVIESGTFGGNEYFRKDGSDWKTKEEARELEITPSTLPTKNK